MRVVCSLCKHESKGLCTKKLKNGNPIKIALNKKRDCSSYSEDALRVLTNYRKREAHTKQLEQSRLMERMRLKVLNDLKVSSPKVSTGDFDPSTTTKK